MKLALITIMALSSISLIAKADTAESMYKKRVYKENCSLGTPLNVYESCQRSRYYKHEIAQCALEKAFNKCELDDNIDCVKVAVEVSEKTSFEFPGFKSCKAEATVHGYGF
ncbi:hypothetical protein HBN50_00995 [Halobacteriovorax sp. GB3]|uniref:hypothetical protein n=1 Tax=Halobacteriovorax sp. GB3 TaxID=2719615 RepID=UPI00235E1FEA|nr:hypothetical protein [Halobacteriovorax sp. GB3]MDD0851643.1 hypothetical protein [Halobacteriovorax sp. GB3]